MNKENKLYAVRNVECHLKSGKVISYWQDAGIPFVELELDLAYEKDGLICFSRVNNPNRPCSIAVVRSSDIECFIDTGIVVITLPKVCHIGEFGELLGWKYMENDEYNK